MLATARKVSASPHNRALSALQFMYRKVPGFADLSMETIFDFDVVDTPVPVAVNAAGISVHNTGPH